MSQPLSSEADIETAKALHLSRIKRACSFCISKKIRCDRLLPSCLNCLKREIKCEYPTFDDGQKKTNAVSMSRRPSSINLKNEDVQKLVSKLRAPCLEMQLFMFFLEDVNVFIPLVRPEWIEGLLGIDIQEQTKIPEFSDQNVAAQWALRLACTSVAALMRETSTNLPQNWSNQARTALKDCFDHVSPIVYAAYVGLAWCHNLLNNNAAVSKYLDLALIIFTRLTPTSPELILPHQYILLSSQMDKNLLHAKLPFSSSHVVGLVLNYIHQICILSAWEEQLQTHPEIITEKYSATHAALVPLHLSSFSRPDCYGPLGGFILNMVASYLSFKSNLFNESVPALQCALNYFLLCPGAVKDSICRHLIHCGVLISGYMNLGAENETLRQLSQMMQSNGQELSSGLPETCPHCICRSLRAPNLVSKILQLKDKTPQPQKAISGMDYHAWAQRHGPSQLQGQYLLKTPDPAPSSKESSLNSEPAHSPSQDQSTQPAAANSGKEVVSLKLDHSNEANCTQALPKENASLSGGLNLPPQLRPLLQETCLPDSLHVQLAGGSFQIPQSLVARLLSEAASRGLNISPEVLVAQLQRELWNQGGLSHLGIGNTTIQPTHTQSNRQPNSSPENLSTNMAKRNENNKSPSTKSPVTAPSKPAPQPAASVGPGTFKPPKPKLNPHAEALLMEAVPLISPRSIEGTMALALLSTSNGPTPVPKLVPVPTTTLISQLQARALSLLTPTHDDSKQAVPMVPLSQPLPVVQLKAEQEEQAVALQVPATFCETNDGAVAALTAAQTQVLQKMEVGECPSNEANCSDKQAGAEESGPANIAASNEALTSTDPVSEAHIKETGPALVSAPSLPSFSDTQLQEQSTGLSLVKRERNEDSDHLPGDDNHIKVPKL